MCCASARDVLRDHPEIASETGRASAALLVDEFQDTSALQRDLVQLLWARDSSGARRRARSRLLADVRRARVSSSWEIASSRSTGFAAPTSAVFAEALRRGALRPSPRAPPSAFPRRGSPDELTGRPSYGPSPRAPGYNRRGRARSLLDFGERVQPTLARPARPGLPSCYEIEYVPDTEDLVPPALPPGSATSAPRDPPGFARPSLEDRRSTLRPPRRGGHQAARHQAASSAAPSFTVREGTRAAIATSRFSRSDTAHARRRGLHALARAGIPAMFTAMAGMGFSAPRLGGARPRGDVARLVSCDLDDFLARAEVLRGPWGGSHRSDARSGFSRDASARRALADVDATGRRRAEAASSTHADHAAVGALAQVITDLRPIVGRVGPGTAAHAAAESASSSVEETLALLAARRAARRQRPKGSSRSPTRATGPARVPRSTSPASRRRRAERKPEAARPSRTTTMTPFVCLTVARQQGPWRLPSCFSRRAGTTGRPSTAGLRCVVQFGVGGEDVMRPCSVASRTTSASACIDTPSSREA